MCVLVVKAITCQFGSLHRKTYSLTSYRRKKRLRIKEVSIQFKKVGKTFKIN